MSIYVNQVGFLPSQSKHATISGEKDFRLINEKGEVVFTGKADTLTPDKASGEETAVIDFSSVCVPGTYHFESDAGVSPSFTVSENVYDLLAFDSLKMFYFQRCGIELTEKYAGRFTHKACHTANVSLLRDPSVVFECNGGWHDAGDFGRYTTAGAVAVGHLLYAFEFNKAKLSMPLNIPESGNGIPDILNECRYELDWLLKMQREDGAVYHKCTSVYHTAFLMPEDDPLPFIVTPISSLAAADFCAVCALAERIYRPYDAQFADTLRVASLKSFDWLKANPGFLFENPKDCTTGDYGDRCDADERMWAVAEVCRMTGDKKLSMMLYNFSELHLSTTALGWQDVAGFASLCVLTDTTGVFDKFTVSLFKDKWLDEANRLLNVSSENGFDFAMRFYEIRWGSNMGVLLAGMVFAVAYWLTNDKKYLNAAGYQVDYILGRNPMNTSYVTGHGEHAFRNPHNRPSASDGIDDPIPGQVSGGPNGHPCDEAACKAIPEGTAPMKCYLDDVGSYSTNEITIYWNSPLVFVLSFLR